jgi:hypothetical protein
MFLVNSRLGLVTATPLGSRSKSFHLHGGTPYPEVTVLFCLVPSPEFSQAPWDSHPAYLCWFTVRTADELPRGFSWRHGVSKLVWPKPHFPASLGVMSSWICLGAPPTPTAALFHQCVCLSFRVTPSVITRVDRCRNVDLLSIGYAFRPRLRIRLTLSGLAFLRKP